MALPIFRVCLRCGCLTAQKIFLSYNQGSGVVGLACEKCGAWIGHIALDDLTLIERSQVLCDARFLDIKFTFHDYEDDDDG